MGADKIFGAGCLEGSILFVFLGWVLVSTVVPVSVWRVVVALFKLLRSDVQCC